MTSTPRFAGRRALVTGASRGIGAGIARRLAAEGADVAIVARTAKRHPTLPGSLLATARAMESSGGNVVRIVADLADQSDQRIIAEATEGLGGPIEILVNNAAAAIYQPMADYPARRIRLTMAVNVEAPFALMRGSSQR
ncbi:MAG: SDR family NAD(P)-dependent oxidoreductase [Acidimicrobiales bacterium]